jgi:hypothetical protein
MEVKINKEIREYSEAIFFGLSLRQAFFSALACGIAVFSYFQLRKYLHIEIVSWLCILVSAPFGALGFIEYHGMKFEQFAWAWIKYQFLIPKHLTFVPVNFYYESVKKLMYKRQKEVMKHHD